MKTQITFIIEKLMAHPKYRALMCGDISACGNDQSRADLSLCLGISFYTKKWRSKQTRSDRKVDDYYEKIRTSKQEKLFHELII
ncbi:MAG: hypothetical protein R3Y45_08500 [Bacillota bacterium]